MESKFIKSAIEKKKKQKKGKKKYTQPIVLFGICLVFAVVGAIFSDGKYSDGAIDTWVVFWTLLGTFVLFALKVASQWEKAIVLRRGKFHALRGPGAFWIIPIIDAIPSWIDHRVMVTPFSAEKTLTKDTVPVDVD